VDVVFDDRFTAEDRKHIKAAPGACDHGAGDGADRWSLWASITSTTGETQSFRTRRARRTAGTVAKVLDESFGIRKAG
jgi:hypothetical protein